jgi:hypothetical protein
VDVYSGAALVTKLNAISWPHSFKSIRYKLATGDIPAHFCALNLPLSINMHMYGSFAPPATTGSAERFCQSTGKAGSLHRIPGNYMLRCAKLYPCSTSHHAEYFFLAVDILIPVTWWLLKNISRHWMLTLVGATLFTPGLLAIANIPFAEEMHSVPRKHTFQYQSD